MTYHLGLGSNLDHPEWQLQQAREAIAALDGVKLTRASRVIVTAPYGNTKQPDFCNQVLEVESDLSPQALLKQLLEIELRMGRKRTVKWGPRVIDIDLLLAGDIVLDTRRQAAWDELPELIIPHPDLANRSFVLQSLNELIPQAVHPVLHKTISELYYALREHGGTK